jgi:hypothetical protein
MTVSVVSGSILCSLASEERVVLAERHSVLPHSFNRSSERRNTLAGLAQNRFGSWLAEQKAYQRLDTLTTDPGRLSCWGRSGCVRVGESCSCHVVDTLNVHTTIFPTQTTYICRGLAAVLAYGRAP